MTSSDGEPRPNLLFLQSGTRAQGNTELLARHAAQCLPSAARQEWITLAELSLPPFADHRHGTQRFGDLEGSTRMLFDKTVGSTDLVFVVPTYWYSLPWPAKLYLDHWTAWLRGPTLGFRERMKGKRLWAITVNSHEGSWASQPLLDSLQLTAKYMAMEWRGGLIGHGSRPGDVLKDQAALVEAERFFAALPL